MPQAPASSSMADSRANIPGHSPGARIQDGVGTSSRTTRWVVRRCGAAYMCLVATADCSANSLSVEVWSMTSWPTAISRPSGPAPSRGDVVFRHAVLQVADHPEQTLVYFTTTEVPESKLADLAAGIG
jgi:hypothetical protein